MKKITLLAVIAAAFGLAACATTDGSTSTSQIQSLTDLEQTSANARAQVQSIKDTYGAGSAATTAASSGSSSVTQGAKDALSQAEQNIKDQANSEKSAWQQTLGF